MLFRRMIPFVVLSLLVAAGCSREDVNNNLPGPDVVASFEGGEITKTQVAAKFESLMPCCKGRYQGDKGRRALIKEMVLPVVISRAVKQETIDLRKNIRKELGSLTDELNMAFLHMKFHEQILSTNEKYQDIKEQYEYQKKVLAGGPLSERYDKLVQLHQEIHPQIAKNVEIVAEDYIRKLRREASITKDYDVLRVEVTTAELKDFYQKHKEGLHGDEYRIPDGVRINEIKDSLAREYRWQKGEDYLKQNRDRILFTINGKPYAIGDFLDVYQRENPSHQCHHMEKMGREENMKEPQQLCDFAHNDIKDQKMFVDRMIDRELIIEDTYNQMIQVEHQKEIEFVTMASLYPIFHREEMGKLIRITDEMVAEYYQKEKKAYMYPAKAKLGMIVIKGGRHEEDKSKAFEKAQKAYKELKPSFFSFKKGKDFAEIARKYSEDDETAAKGGRIEVDVYECRSAIDYMLFHGFHKEIFALNPGDISDMFEFENNYYILQIREMERRKQMVFEEIREQVKKDLMVKEHQKVMQGWEDEILKSAGFAIYDQAFKEVLAEAESKELRKADGS